MSQIPLLEESLESAMGSDIQALGGAKKFGSMLWPEMDPDSAGKKVSRCINPHCDERFNYQQIMLLIRKAKEVGSYVTVFFLTDDGGFSRPTPIEPEDERAILQREFIETGKRMEQMLKQLQAIQAPLQGRR